MSKMKLVLEVVEDLRSLASSLEYLVKVICADEEQKNECVVENVEVVTIEFVRSVLASKAQSGKQKEVKALIEKFGGKKLTDIQPDLYEALLKEAEVL